MIHSIELYIKSTEWTLVFQFWTNVNNWAYRVMFVPSYQTCNSLADSDIKFKCLPFSFKANKSEKINFWQHFQFSFRYTYCRVNVRKLISWTSGSIQFERDRRHLWLTFSILFRRFSFRGIRAWQLIPDIIMPRACVSQKIFTFV